MRLCSAVELPVAGSIRSTPMIALELSGKSALCVGDNEGQIRILRMPGGQLISACPIPDVGPISVFASHVMGDVKSLFAVEVVGILGGYDGMVHTVDLFTGHAIGSPDRRHLGAVTALASFRLDGRFYAVSGGLEGNVHVREVRRHAIEDSFLPVRTVGVLPLLNGDAVITAGIPRWGAG